MHTKIFILLLLLIFAGCRPTTDTVYKELSKLDKKNISYQGHYKVGHKYTINNKVYVPQKKVADDYIEFGIASWYGKKDHKKKTANGDVFNKYLLTAAHPYLPMPCAVKVTIDEKSLIVMINDRGPFNKGPSKDKRAIDLSEAAAEILGFKRQGIANAKIEYLPKETEKLLTKLKLDKKEGSKSKSFVQNQKCSVNCYLQLINIKHNLLPPPVGKKNLLKRLLSDI